MNKNISFILLCILIPFAHQVNSQYDYFHGQKNVFSFHINANPRFTPMLHNDDASTYDQDYDYDYGYYYNNNYQSGYGTYYIKNNEDGQTEVKKQNFNIQLNMFYGRLFKKRVLLGIDMNYQSHNMTFLHQDLAISNFKTTPLFHVVDAQLSFGLFLGKQLSPNKHLLQIQAGPKMYFLNTSKEYRDSSGEPYEDLDKYMKTENKPFTYFRLNVNYTRRILLTERISLDLGFTSNFGLFGPMSPYSIISIDPGVRTDVESVKNRLGYETFRNIFYLSAGISYAF